MSDAAYVTLYSKGPLILSRFEASRQLERWLKE